MALSMNKLRLLPRILTMVVFCKIAHCSQITKPPTTSNKVTTIASVSTPTSTRSSFTTSAFNTTCGINSTTCSSNTTLVTNLTTISLNVTSTVSPTTVSSASTPGTALKNKKKSPPNNLLQKDSCVCDLQLDYCDLNCCCDRDCSSENKLVFDHCMEEFQHYDSRLCHYVKTTYINQTTYAWEVNQNSVFCVIRSNLPPTYPVQRTQPLKTFEESEFQKKDNFFWPEISTNKREVFNFTNGYIYSSPLWIIRNNTLDKLHIFNNFITNDCLVKEIVKYLVNMQSVCRNLETGENGVELNAETYFRNISVVAVPNKLNVSLLERNGFKSCAKNVCLPIDPQICDGFFSNCGKPPRNFSSWRATCRWSFSENANFCRDVVEKVKYIFHHNGTNGITKIDVLLVLTNITYISWRDLQYFQHFEVNFMWSNHTLNYSSSLSGNPGYLNGKPILIANLITERISSNNTNSSLTNGTHYVTKLFRNSTSFAGNFLVVPQNLRGRCELDTNRFTAVEFGYNLYTKCEIQDVLENSKNISAASLCKIMQNTIFKYWSLNATNNTLLNKLVGQFGNANSHIMDQWTSVLFPKDLNETLDNIWGQFGPKNKTVNCGNIATQLMIDIFHARLDFKKILDQEKIMGTTFRFDNFRNLTFPYEASARNVNVSVRITTQVMFFDITTRKIRRIVDPPSLRVKLPYDFFYPFIKVDNNSSMLYSLSHVVLVGVIFVLCV